MRKFFFHPSVNLFPEKYSRLKRIFAQMIFLCFSIIIHDRDNLLTQKDVKRARKELKQGDILLVGNLRILFSKLVRSPVTHSLLYLGRGKFIHATVDGVGYVSYHEVAVVYDTMVILRISDRSDMKSEIIPKAISFAKAQVGKAYNFFLDEEELSFFCSQLINNAFIHAGYDTRLESRKSSKFGLNTIIHPMKFDSGVLRAGDFVLGNFDIVFTSQNVMFLNGRLNLLDEKKV